MGFLAKLFGGRGSEPPRVDLWRRFEKMRESHAGTMSVFYKVRERASGEVRGLKLIDRGKSDPVAGRYRRLDKPSEGEIGRAIVGPHVARTLAWGRSLEGDPFVLMEYVEGTLLHSIIAARRSGRAPEAQAATAGSPALFDPAVRLDLVRQAASAVATVHAAGFVHRDICPRNFILRPDGRLVLIDFGLTVPDRPAFFQPGNRVGTPDYMAPEVVRRRQADRRLDLFSFGVTAFEICSLELPWRHGTSGTAALAHDSPPTDIRRHWPDAPPALSAAIMACIAAAPAERPASLEDFLQRISRVSL